MINNSLLLKNRLNITSVQDKFLRKKEGIGDTPKRGNFTIATKTNPYGKIITFLTNDKYHTQRDV